MTKKRKPNISPVDIGSYYTDGEIIYQLESCETEPQAIMWNIKAGQKLSKSISEFANFVKLKPERPIPEKIIPRKARADKGKTQGKKDIESALPISSVEITLHCLKCGMVTTTLVDGKPLCLICQDSPKRRVK